MLAGDRSAIDAFVGSLTKSGGPSNSVRRAAVDVAQAGATVASLVASSGEYVRLSERTMSELAKHGPAAAGDSGYFSGVIRKADGSITSHIEWSPANLDPMQALALQQLATTMALRMAIEEVAQAVARVEGKVNDLVDLVKSERLGYAIADHRFLAELIERVDAGGDVSDIDWSTIAHLGADIGRDIEAIRAYIRLRLADEKERRSTRSRAERLEELAESKLEVVLAALVLAEHNLATWQRLRIARHATHEPSRLTEVTKSAEKHLTLQQAADQELVTDLENAIDALTESRGLEGLSVTKRKQLIERAEEANDVVDWFAGERMLEVTDSDVQQPGFKQSVNELSNRIVRGSRLATAAAKQKLPKLGRDDAPMEELEMGDDRADLPAGDRDLESD